MPSPKINIKLAAYIGGMVAGGAVYFLVIQPYRNRKSQQQFEAEARALYEMRLRRQIQNGSNEMIDNESFK